MKFGGALLTAFLCLGPTVAQATLKIGDAAPDFSIPAALGGKEFNFSLARQLEKGPVVLYFYPKSFTRGCTIEAHEFADHQDDFVAAGASVLGVSSDPIEVQKEFSSKECRDKFPVGADPSLATIKAYDARRDKPSPSGGEVADRVSYVIADGKIVFALVDSNPVNQVQTTLEFVRRWNNEQRARQSPRKRLFTWSPKECRFPYLLNAVSSASAPPRSSASFRSRAPGRRMRLPPPIRRRPRRLRPRVSRWKTGAQPIS